MTHEEKIARWIGPGKIGVEIGAFKSPVPGLSPAPFYVDCFGEFGGERVHADYYGHATALPFRDNSLDYVITSHVLEHVANPVAALAEWRRVLRPGGIIYLLVPDRRFTWDHPRALTPVAHLLDDFTRGTTARDATHIDDFVSGVDWASYSPGTPPTEIAADRATRARALHDAVARGEEINIHFHTFEPANVLSLFAALRDLPEANLDCEVLDHAERFPANNPIGFLAIVRVNKPWRDHLAAWCYRRRTAHDPKFSLLPGARAFDEFAAATPVAPLASCLDDPAENSPIPAAGFTVRGWLWLGARHGEIASIQAHLGDALVGETAALHVRPDVCAALALPATAATGFAFSCVLPAVSASPLKISALLRGGARSPLATRPLTVAAP